MPIVRNGETAVKKYKITYVIRGDLKKITIEAPSANHAKIKMYLLHKCDDILSVEEITDDV